MEQESFANVYYNSAVCYDCEKFPVQGFWICFIYKRDDDDGC